VNCCQCQGIEDLFNEQAVTRELRQYREKGPDKTTRMLIEGLKAEGVQGLNLLDIGGGVGAIQHQLMAVGVNQAIDVDASRAYLQAARDEANRRGIAERIRFQHGNFVDIAPQIAPANIVTLDRVVCCYPDMENLVGLSAARATKLYGLVYPRDTRFAKFAMKVLNFLYWLRRKPFRIFVHSTQAVDALVRSQGLQRKFYRRTFIWQIVVYGR
jgi:magnesium-protoporphyrin O-methyltransferase